MNLEGRIVRLRAVEPADAEMLYDWENDTSVWSVSGTTEPFSRAQMEAFVAAQQQGDLFRTVQSWLIAEADPQNHREAKENSAYYLLKKSAVPAIICECGFLSNPEECEKLCTPEYQQKIAVSIFQGIMEYLDTAGL